MSKLEEALRAIRQGFYCVKCDGYYDGHLDNGTPPPCADCQLAYSILGKWDEKDAAFIENWLNRRIKQAVQEAVQATIAELKERGR